MHELSLADTAELLSSQVPAIRDVGLQQVLRELPASAPLAVRRLARMDDPDAQWLMDNLKVYCPYLRPAYSDPVTDPRAEYALFDDLRKEMAALLLAVREALQTCSDAEHSVMLRRLACFPGIAPDVAEIVRADEGDEAAGTFAAMESAERSKAADRQLMLFLSHKCNLSCPYCFATGKKGDMSLARAIDLIDWAQANGARVITFLGGEPTIYPHFPAVLDELRSRGLYTYFATNLLAEPDVSRSLRNDVVKSLTVHVAHKHVYGTGQWEMLLNNMEVVLSQGVQVALRANAYAPGHDWTHLFGLAERFGLREVQYGLTFPAPDATNAFVKRADLASAIPGVLDMQRRCDERGLRLSMAKPVPVCLLPKQAQLRAIRQPRYQLSCNISDDGYAHNVCALPSGDFAPCLAMLDVTLPGSEVRDWTSLSSFCESQVRPLLEAPLFEDCPGCFLHARRICQGACVGHKREPAL